MADSHVISGLKAKRARLVSELDALAEERRRLQTNLRHLDSTLKLMGFEGDPAAIQGKRRYHSMFLKGELRRFVLGAIREHGADISHKEVAALVLQHKGWEDDGELLTIVTGKVSTARKNMRRT